MSELMYKCQNCGHVFEPEAAASWFEDCGEVSGCPICGDGYFEVKPCPLCGEYDAMEEDEPYCERCRDELSQRVEELIKAKFSDEEIDCIVEMYGL